ncbi:ferritin family protein [Bradyrhizobium sp. BR13661]|jgi:rubrerythrin|uniref:ferritin family protein n=1 Tax=Bradyrhizobium sp. BR13661 TaxID=2940622 RepID=UPI0024757D28|nr:ferritin family protein [Bradyrhizobium sp. BR13661]MDH6259100.1 rubrerythrin [Bradyrhizobium sp. BR13661]
MKDRIRSALLSATATAMLLSLGAALADEIKPETRRDLQVALQKEAYSVLKYRAFAENARKNGKVTLAALLEETAKFEEQHFFAEAKMYGLVGEDWNNLANAIVSEYNDYTDNYVKLAERAEENGDKQIATMYREIAADEEKHHKNFKAAISKALKPD